MSNAEDDDFVVPAGSRRSSYVPPAEEQVLAPEQPPVSEPEISTAPTDPLATIAPAGDDWIAQTPTVAESVPEPALSIEIPVRKSLTREALAATLSGTDGLSSNDRMALLDSQVAFREADVAAVAAFVQEVQSANSIDALAALDEVNRRFGDITTENFPTANEVPRVASMDFDDETTPVTGIPVVVEEQPEPVTDVVALEAIAEPGPLSAESDRHEWSLAAPIDVSSGTNHSVARHKWWTASANLAVLISVLLLSVGAVAFSAGSTPALYFVLAGLVGAIPFLELARRGSAKSGASWRMFLQNTFGRIPGRVFAVLMAALVLTGLVSVMMSALNGLGLQVEQSEMLSDYSNLIPATSAATLLVALTLLGGAVIAALPHSWFKASALVLTGWSLVGTGALVAMGSALIVTTVAVSEPELSADIEAAGVTAAIALLLVSVSLFGFHEISRVRERSAGTMWLSIGLGLGLIVLGGTVASALLAPEGTHYFFGHNPVLHIVAPSALLNIVLGACALAPSVVLLSALIFRALAAVTTRDDSEKPSIALRLILLLVPLGIGAVGYLGYGPTVADSLPSLTAHAIPVAAILGVMAALGTTGRQLKSRPAQGGLVIVALLTITVGLGFGSSSGAAFGWVGFINTMLVPFGYGLVLVDSLAPLATGLLGFLLALVIVIPFTRRAARDA
jgi:hypothetical protein